MPEDSIGHIDFDDLDRKAISRPVVTHIYTADPSAHVFGGKIYIYPSHDIESGVPFDDTGSHFAMRDYHVLSMDHPDGPAVDHGIALDITDVPWAEKQMWAPDAAFKKDRYYFYFPAKARNGLFQIGVATGDTPAGPFIAEPTPIEGSYSIDPCVFTDDDGRSYMYFGGLWGGQLQSYRGNAYDKHNEEPPAHEPALGPRIALLTDDMRSFAEPPAEIVITDEQGMPLLAGDNDRRFFEASWMHKFNGKYYFSYSTGDTHFICYAVGNNPYGPFIYKGIVLAPVVGWTNHHSITEFRGRWYLFYHDSSLSKGVTHLRCVKATPLHHDPDGTITTVKPYR